MARELEMWTEEADISGQTCKWSPDMWPIRISSWNFNNWGVNSYKRVVSRHGHQPWRQWRLLKWPYRIQNIHKDSWETMAYFERIQYNSEGSPIITNFYPTASMWWNDLSQEEVSLMWQSSHHFAFRNGHITLSPAFSEQSSWVLLPLECDSLLETWMSSSNKVFYV